MTDHPRLRIMMVTKRWPGSNAEALYQSLKRAGHSLWPVEEGLYFPEYWQSLPLKAVRRLCQPLLVREMHRAVIAAADWFCPHLFLAFKGAFVQPSTLEELGSRGIVRINWYPDVSFTVHSRYLSRSLPLYDWVFTTKTFGMKDMKDLLGVADTSVLLHGYDPEVHAPQDLTRNEQDRYGCDASFIGTWSPKKQRYLEEMARLMPGINLKIWGSQWENALPGPLDSAVQCRVVAGREYAKAITASKINLAILSEKRSGASSGDLITSRTFHIPASGGFMLHERTDELREIFAEDEETACFASPAEMTEKTAMYLEDPAARQSIAARGRQRCVPKHGMDQRAQVIIAKYNAINKRITDAKDYGQSG